MMKTLSIRPALPLFMVEATQGWLGSVQVCAAELLANVGRSLPPAYNEKQIVSAVDNSQSN